MKYLKKDLRKLKQNSELELLRSVTAEGGLLWLCLCDGDRAWIHERDMSDEKTEVFKVEVKNKR